jgi:phosphonate transport system substrate-binding protein
VLTFGNYLAPSMMPLYEAVTWRVGELLGCPTQLVTGSTFDQFERGEVDAGFVCGLPYVRLAAGPRPQVAALAAPVLQGSRFAGRPVYFSDVIVRSDSPHRSFEELRGCSWSYNDVESQSGCGITLYRLATLGVGASFFSRVVAAGFHQTSIHLVASGKVDASAVDCQVLAVELRDHPELAPELRIIDTLGPSTIQPVVASTRLPTSLRDEIREAFLSLGDDATVRGGLDHGCVERFTAVDDSAYDDIRGMLREIERRGLLEEWKHASVLAGEL